MNSRSRLHAWLAIAPLAALPLLADVPAAAQTPPAAALVEARVVPGTPPTLQLLVPPAPAAEGAPRSRVVQVVVDRQVLADALVRDQTDELWQDIGKVNGVLRDAGGDPLWYVMRSDAADPAKVRIGIANFNLNEGGDAPLIPGNKALRILLPLRAGDLALPNREGRPFLPLEVSVGISIDQLSRTDRVDAWLEKPADVDQEAKVRFGTDVSASLTGTLAIGAPVTLSWKIADCVQATLSGPVDYRQPVLAITPENGVCAGSKKVLALGPATYQLTAEISGEQGSRVSVVVTRTVTLDVRRFDQFANLTLTPSSVLPGGKVRARWYIRELPADDRREAMLSWTDANGNRRLQRLRASASQTTSGEMSFAVPQSASATDTSVRLHYGEETIARSFDIERWQPAGTSTLATGALRGLAFAGGRLVLCSEQGLFLADVGAGGGIGPDGSGKTNDPFPPFARVPLRIGGQPDAAGPVANRQPLQEAPCLAVRAIDAERVAVLAQIDTPVPTRPAYAELTLLSPRDQVASYPVTLTDDPINTTAAQRRDYQLGMLRGRLFVQVQIGPIDRKGGLNARSSVKTFSIAESDMPTGKAGWRNEPALSSVELSQNYGWHLVDGFGTDNEFLFLINEVTGATLRFEASPDSAKRLAQARSSGSPARLTAAREAVEIEYPTPAKEMGREWAAALSAGPVTNVGGVIVGLGAGLAYNPQTNEWQQGSFGLTGSAGAVAAYRGDGEPRLWLMKANGERLSLTVESPRLFAADYFENTRAASLPYLVLGAKVTTRTREARNWRTEKRTELEKKDERSEMVTCTVKGVISTVPMVVSEFTLFYPDRPFEFVGRGADRKTDVSKAHLGAGNWDATTSLDPCESVRIEPIPVPSP
ncbi:hypothetical protein [Ancylobacter polymorphus]|uniref:Uncharacterized protein n=1 Tax=Ancylobacter polymorphus TaxID=223390 RepID=A0ABU0BAW8_9HYPH|nr:hypothetical protein [Ancylobacter polymorphus]MDQ0302987.1 hypothetical protein [Ancylobacter polymorphus]